jgi:two-component system sensor histidine kinase QseC
VKISIRNKLLVLLLSFISGLWGIVTWRVYLDTQHEIEELFDANLAQSAKVLFGLVNHEMEETDELDEDEEDGIELDEHLLGHKYEHKLAFIIRTADGQVLIRSLSAPPFPQPTMPLKRFEDYQIHGKQWRVFTLLTERLIVQTGERYDIRNELIKKIVSSTLLAPIIALPFLALLIWLIIGYSFQPLQYVANEIATRRAEQLQPIDVSKIPMEIRVLVEALNSLLKRLAYAFDNERRFTADAAHELRTPLAGLKTQAQVAQRAADSKQRQQALQQILLGVDRATHLVSQLLTLARMDAMPISPTIAVDMYSLVSELVVELTPQAIDKSIDLGIATTATAHTILGHKEALQIMFRNFIDNAIRYTPHHGQVTVLLINPNSYQLSVSINDSGFGILSEQREKVFERFYRGNQHNEVGSGLGLSIAQRVAQLHQVEIYLNNVPNGKGLQVRVDFNLSNS